MRIVVCENLKLLHVLVCWRVCGRRNCVASELAGAALETRTQVAPPATLDLL